MVDRQALIIIDAQNDFFSGGVLAVKGAEKVIGPINALTERFFEANRPVFLSRDHHPPTHDSFVPKGEYPPHCVMGSKGAQIHKDINLTGIVLIDKCYSKEDISMSAFGDGRLDKILAMSGVRELFVMGVSTEYGIKASVMDALAKGFQVSVVEDGIVPESTRSGDKAIATMVKAGAQFISLKSAVEALPSIEFVKDM